MSLTIPLDPLPLRIDDTGVPRVAGTRIPLERVIRAYRAGDAPEVIVEDFDTLDLADVYTLIGFYLRHQRDVDAYLAECDRRFEEIRRQTEGRFPPDGVRERLVARRGVQPPARP